MAAKVVWLDQAKDDLRAILDYLHPHNPRAALDYVFEVEQSCSKLADFPLQGRKYDERYRAIITRKLGNGCHPCPAWLYPPPPGAGGDLPAEGVEKG